MYDASVVRDLFEKWGHDEPVLDPDLSRRMWTVPHVNHMVLKRWLPDTGAVLDAGCGMGYEAVMMAQRGMAVTALDISTSLLRHARRRAELAGVADRVAFVHADLTEPLPLPAESFDACVAMTAVISHTGSAHREALAHLVSCCKPGGLVILGVDSYYGKIRQYLHEGRVDAAEHLAETRYTSTVSETFEDYCFTPQEITEMLAGLGCQAREMAAAPTVAGYGYVGAPPEDMPRALALEGRFLGTPDLLGAGEQIIGVFVKA